MDKIKYSILEKELYDRIKWFIYLRWIASVGLFLVITVSYYILKVDLIVIPLYIGNGFLLVYNTLFYFHYRKSINKWLDQSNTFANIQISLDLIMLTYLIYFSGDIENPFVFFYIFHMVIASILLTNRAAYLQATLAIFLLGGVFLLICLKIIPHHHVLGELSRELCTLNYPYFLIKFSVFIVTLYFTVYMSTTIANKLRERELDLEVANTKLEKQDKLKSEYVLTVSHDLKSSLSAIQSCLVVVLSDLVGAVSEKAREMITRAEQRSLSLIKFVEDLLNLSRIRASNNLEKQKVSLSELVYKTTEQLVPLIKNKNLNILTRGFNSNCYVYANNRELEGLFMNLLSNAVKYTPPEGEIGISCRKSKKEEYYQITVSDTGIGVPRSDLPHIFDDFYRGENARVFDKDGTGLGLSIVKHIINDMGCEIKAESQLNKGTKFIFNLPAQV
ncbi:MAG: hypothetical protein JSV22_06635 [Bacteroidales bacterium]|nr:MAG: hypothetical protein JSV22_06635 [Bacteroidales bacterium]